MDLAYSHTPNLQSGLEGFLKPPTTLVGFRMAKKSNLLGVEIAILRSTKTMGGTAQPWWTTEAPLEVTGEQVWLPSKTSS